jgi:hypothetical protein
MTLSIVLPAVRGSEGALRMGGHSTRFRPAISKLVSPRRPRAPLQRPKRAPMISQIDRYGDEIEARVPS